MITVKVTFETEKEASDMLNYTKYKFALFEIAANLARRVEHSNKDVYEVIADILDEEGVTEYDLNL